MPTRGLTSETTPLGVVSYVNDALGRRSSMTTPGQTALTYGYDSGDRLNQITQGSTSVSMTYDTAGRRSALTLPNGIVPGLFGNGSINTSGLIRAVLVEGSTNRTASCLIIGMPRISARGSIGLAGFLQQRGGRGL
jgi:YD repeat-containing protein